jgi:hypothetical protein
MKKIIFVIAFIALLAGSFFFYYGQKNVIADDKQKSVSNTENTQSTDCQKSCDGNCASCTKQCETNKSAGTTGESQVKNCPKSNCSTNSSAGMTKGSCTYKK